MCVPRPGQRLLPLGTDNLKAVSLGGKEIADDLGISYRTVENHRNHICEKLDIHGSHALLKFAIEHRSSL